MAAPIPEETIRFIEPHRTDGCDPGRSADAVQINELTPATPEPLLAAARELLLEYGRFVLAQPGAARFCFGTLQQEAEGLPDSFLCRGGGSLLALVRNEPAGFVAWRALPSQSAAPDFPIAASPISGSSVLDSPIPDSWELKRLWVRPTARGLALGRRLTQAVLDRAVAAGRAAIYLDTAPQSMASAHRLYLDMGFIPCAPYNDNPVEGLVWMVKFL
jgi:ribosomal protein S18 acetylase RimI-like enzyme